MMAILLLLHDQCSITRDNMDKKIVAHGSLYSRSVEDRHEDRQGNGHGKKVGGQAWLLFTPAYTAPNTPVTPQTEKSITANKQPGVH
jgi:hypothetical protein